MESNQNAGRLRSARTCQHMFIPEIDAIKAARRKLPDFEPYDTRKLLAEARNASLEGRSIDEAVTATYNKHCRSQTAKLLHALGCDPADPNIWRTAFLRLARLHHNLGALVHRRRAGRSNDASQRFRDEWILLCGVGALVEPGYGQRKAVDFIADKEVFPYRETRPGLRDAGRATQHARRAALWQKYQRLRRGARSTPDPLARAFGLSSSDYELGLARLDNPLPDPPFGGDKGEQQKKRVRKSPTS